MIKALKKEDRVKTKMIMSGSLVPDGDFSLKVDFYVFKNLSSTGFVYQFESNVLYRYSVSKSDNIIDIFEFYKKHKDKVLKDKKEEK